MEKIFGVLKNDANLVHSLASSTARPLVEKARLSYSNRESFDHSKIVDRMRRYEKRANDLSFVQIK